MKEKIEDIEITFEENKPEPAEKEKGSEQNEFQARFEQEKREMQERFGDLIGLVNQRYESKNFSEKELADYKQHNQDILDYAIEMGMRKEFSQEELKILSISAILHDLTKLDSTPPKLKNIKNYALVAHGQTAAAESGKILSDQFLKEHGFDNSSPEDLERVREHVSQAIAQHMGPHPGFMTNILKGVNKALKKEGHSIIEHPPAQGKISETLLAADMRSLVSVNGRKKIMSIRAHNNFFYSLDKQTTERYQDLGVELRQGEAALLSGFESAKQAIAMIKNPQDKMLLEKIFWESQKKEYKFGEDSELVNFNSAKQKEEDFQKRRLVKRLT